jgi:hypothetical protein
LSLSFTDPGKRPKTYEEWLDTMEQRMDDDDA